MRFSGLPVHSFPWISECLSESAVDAQIEINAQAAFIEDYCLIQESNLSLGYLEGLQTLLAMAEPSSNIAQATEVVALASISSKLRRSTLLHKARMMYSALLRSFQMDISKTAFISETESIMTIVLLGLYEVCVS
jgi:hypothetical protein